MARHSIGRPAIDVLKNAYRDGYTFPDIYAVRDFVISKLGVKPKSVSWGQAGSWDRQARLENADDRYATTSPSPRNGYMRNPNADGPEREDSHKAALKHVATRLENELRVARAGAAQTDATKVEIQREARLDLIAPLLRHLASL